MISFDEKQTTLRFLRPHLSRWVRMALRSKGMGDKIQELEDDLLAGMFLGSYDEVRTRIKSLLNIEHFPTAH